MFYNSARHAVELMFRNFLLGICPVAQDFSFSMRKAHHSFKKTLPANAKIPRLPNG
jgi:hypothetical protein